MNKFATKKIKSKHNTMEKRESFQQMVLDQLDIHTQNNESDPDLTLFTKINSIWIIDLNIKCKSVKLPKDNIGENFDDIGCSDNFLI